MNQIAKAKLSDSAVMRWLALSIVSGTMMFAYFFTDVMSPLESMLSEELGWDANEYGFFSGAYGLMNVFLLMLFFGGIILDISTGEFLTGQGPYDYVEKLLGNFSPKEVLYDKNKKREFEQYFGTKLCVFELDDWVFTEQNARQKLLKHFGTKSLKGFGVEHLKEGIVASGAIMQYLELTQHTNINHITSLFCPLTVTLPGLSGCLNCLWSPFSAIFTHPSRSSSLMTSDTLYFLISKSFSLTMQR